MSAPGLFRTLAYVSSVCLLLSCNIQPAPPAASAGPGPLRVNPANPRYFTDNSGKAIYLTGFHTWANMQEFANDSTKAFDNKHYLDMLDNHNCNFIRLWTWEHFGWNCWAPDTAMARIGPFFRYRRTGPDLATDSLPRFDVTRFNPVYFDRLRERVVEAGKRNIYVMIMLFNGFSIEQKGGRKGHPEFGNPWKGHPFNRLNNINGIDGDTNGNGEGEETHQLVDPKIVELQKAYVRKVADTVRDLDNVMYEISNESNKEATSWQYELIDYIHEYEKTLPKQHPVIMTFQYPGGTNEELFASPAEGVSPNPGPNDAYKVNPPAADGSKVVLADTDHLWGHGGNRVWVWKCFLRGLNPVLMDPFEPLFADTREINRPDLPEWEEVRKNMGYTRGFAARMNLTSTAPRGELASSGYCLAGLDKGREELLVYLPEGGNVDMDLSGIAGEMQAEWFDPTSGATADRFTVTAGGKLTFMAPFSGHAVLYLHRGGTI